MLKNFSSLVGTYKSHSFYVNSKNIEITHASDTDDIINELINSFKSN